MKNIFYLLLLALLNTTVFAQLQGSFTDSRDGKVYRTANNDSISISKKEITDAKGLALCYCFVFMNEKDSLSIMNKDVSGSYFTEYSTLSIDQMNGIRDFVRQNIDSFFAVPWQVGHNMITYTCWTFYESDKLDLFVKELLREEQ